MLASAILQRVIVSPTATTIRGATATAAAFSDGGVLVPEDMSCTNLDAADVQTGTVVAGTIDAVGRLQAGPSEGFQQVYRTGPLNLLTPVSGIVLVPARAGFFPVMQSRNWVIQSHAGTQTAPPTIRAGSDAGHVNFIASTSTTPSNAEVNGGAVPFLAGGPTFPAVALQRFANTDVIFDLTVAATGTGGYACTAELVISVDWFPA